jgi:hypothetical protein
MTSRTFEIKEPDVKLEDMYLMKPSLIIVWGFLSKFCHVKNLECKITNIKTKFPQSVSNTHPEGRALDISLHSWSILQVRESIEYLERHAGHLGAIVGRGQRRLVVHHDIGLGDHLHIQTAPEQFNEID